METTNTVQLLRLSEVSKCTTLGKSTINLWVAQGKFPRPTILSPTIKVWKLKELEQWLEDRAGSTQLADLPVDSDSYLISNDQINGLS